MSPADTSLSYLPLAASTPSTETSLVRRCGRECSEKSEDEKWRRTKEEAREGTEQKAMPVIVKALVSFLSVMMLCYHCLPHISHTTHRGGSDFSLTPSRVPLLSSSSAASDHIPGTGALIFLSCWTVNVGGGEGGKPGLPNPARRLITPLLAISSPRAGPGSHLSRRGRASTGPGT